MSRIPKVVPWTSTEEYMDVASHLYSEDISERSKGVAIVKSWRVRGKVPVAIDATANLVEIIVADQDQCRGATINQLRHMYNMALIRFVNSIVDLEQKGMYAQSIAVIANRIGMPAWFVELRHAGTHEQIPSLAVLRSACNQALYWLRNYYWDKQTRTLPEDTLHRIRDALSQYINGAAKLAAAEKPGTKKAQAALAASEASLSALSELVSRLHSDAVRLYVVPALVEVGLLVPEDKRLRSKFPDCKMSPSLADMWKPAFQLFQETWGEGFFFDELLAGVVGVLSPDSAERGIFEAGDSSLSTSHAATLVSWIRWTLENYYSPNDATGQSVSIDGMLEGCLRNPNYFSRAVLKTVSAIDPALKKDLKPFVDYMGKALAALVSAESSEKSKSGKPTAVISEKALEQEEETMRRRLEEFFKPKDQAQQSRIVPQKPASTDSHSVKPAGRWSYVTEAAWAACPIGTTSDGDIPSLEWPAWVDEVCLHQSASTAW